ncbi:MAG: hypothetical protein JKY56_10365 [Kofleriaceae bacterium]|nr:hypothetical protein [Kofleriaceae bacterium]
MLKPSLLLALLLCSCSKEDVNVERPTVPEEQPVKLPKLEAAIASVQLQEDCPDAPPPDALATPATVTPPPADAPAESTPAGLHAGTNVPPIPCVQSRIQITFTSDASQPVSISAIRLLSDDGKVLSAIKYRGPSIWRENRYTPWDEVVGVGKNTQASYKIAPPAWGVVETALGKGSYNTRFVVEVDINFQGKTKTIRSNSFVRTHPIAPPPT